MNLYFRITDKDSNTADSNTVEFTSGSWVDVEDIIATGFVVDMRNLNAGRGTCELITDASGEVDYICLEQGQPYDTFFNPPSGNIFGRSDAGTMFSVNIPIQYDYFYGTLKGRTV